jgi:hypothetical protein
MDAEFFKVLEDWATVESKVFSAKADSEADALAVELSLIEDATLCLRPVTKQGALAQLQFVAGYLERSGDDGLLSGAVRHVVCTLTST